MFTDKLNIKALLIAVLLFAAFINAQDNLPADIPAVSQGDIQFYADYAVFRGTEGSQYTEFYLMVFGDQLTVVNNKASFDVESEITNMSGDVISSKEWITEADITKDSLSVAKVIFDQWSQPLSPGNYNLNVTLTDKESGKKGSLRHVIIVAGFTEKELNVSSIEFVSRVEKTKSETPFNKVNKTVLPNPSRRFGVLNPVLYTYFELYTSTELVGKKIGIKYSISDVSASVVKEFPVIDANITAASTGFNHGLNVARIPSGIYNLNIEAAIPEENKTITTSRRFEIIQKDFTELQPVLSVNDAETFEKLLKLTGEKNQLKIYQQLQLNAKAEFIVQYWRSVDPTPGTPENEYLEKIQQRFIYANKNFSWGGIPGWETERGRVLIQYGMPDEIKKYNSEADRVPYEIWQYMQEKNFYFVFGDLNSNGRYILLHSNKDGEISNENWQSEIKKM